MKRLTQFVVVLILGVTVVSFQSFSQDASSEARKELVIAVPGGTVRDSLNIDPVIHDSKEKAIVKSSESYKTAVTASVIPNLITLHPMAVSFVKGYMSENTSRLEKMRSTGISNFRTIDNILGKYRLPEGLKYLAVIESDLKSTALSRVGALGPWQLMPETARLLGLKVGKGRDERKDLYKSTHAAAKYLRDLYSELGDWLLVVAAYNGGQARVEYAIRKSKSRDFWKLQHYLPAESRNHVKKFIATHYIMEGQGGVCTVGANSKYDFNAVDSSLMANTETTVISGKYNSAILTKSIEMDINLFNQLNPRFDASVMANPFTLRLPADRMQLFNARKMEILNESVLFLLTNSSGEEQNRYPKEISFSPANESGINSKSSLKK
ncbi:lytic transglycosylase domain-containing protein [Pollutibacter soli]|uniref:lytic transglycosylase domain-containing protein n=1 Tax=Pollutibacter soli TaxID=3034157 RepID=UPI0030141326